MKLPKTIIMLDTETISINKRFVYDIGYAVAVFNGKEYETVKERHYMIKQVYDHSMLFETAYYSEKRPDYVKLLKGKRAKREYLGWVMHEIAKDIEQYNIEYATAYNSPFDKTAIEFTTNYFKTKNPLNDIEWFDTQNVAAEFIHKTKQFQDFANRNEFITDNGNLKTNAEITYSAIIDDPTFEEEHMGLQDVRIELSILNECVKLGFSEVKKFNRRFIPSTIEQKHTVIKGNKTYTYKYNSKKNTRKGLVLN